MLIFLKNGQYDKGQPCPKCMDKKTDAEGNDCAEMIYDGRNEIRGQRLTEGT